MTYQEMNDLYRDGAERGRMEACIRQQAYIYSSDPQADIAALGRGIVGGSMTDIDAVIAAICTAPGASVTTDPELLSATQFVWPTVASARYPQA